MPDQWIIRVQGKEYGPVGLDTLREWRRDGRVIPENEVRRSDDSTWSKAGSIAELFAPPPSVANADSTPVPQRSRTLGEIILETFRIYREGFMTFLGLTLLVAIPSCLLKICLAFFSFSEHGLPTSRSLIPRVLAVVVGALLLTTWPIFLAGIQIATSHLMQGHRLGFRDVLRRAIGFWPRVAALCLLVYGSYFVWSAIPLLAIVSLVVGEVSLVSLLLSLVILGLQVYMTARLFVNFLFWQQSSVIAGHETLAALRESKELAHSRPRARRLERPLYLGAILASLWLLLVFLLSVTVQMPFMLMRLHGITNIEDAMALAQNLANASSPDAITLATYVATSVIQALLRPLLGIAFVVLYFEAKKGVEGSSGMLP